jgi:hypothetical protein
MNMMDESPHLYLTASINGLMHVQTMITYSIWFYNLNNPITMKEKWISNLNSPKIRTLQTSMVSIENSIEDSEKDMH